MRTTIRWPLLALGCAALALGAACSSSGDKLVAPQGGSGTQPAEQGTLPAGHPTVDPATADLPVEALLSEADLSSDWAQGSHQDDPLAPTDSYYCGKKVSSLQWTHLAQFANDKTGAMMIHILSKFPNVAAAQAAIKQERDATAGCDTWSSSTGADKVEWHIQSVQNLDFGDEAFAEKSTTTAGQPLQLSTDFSVIVRKGDTIILIDEGGSGDIDGTEAIAAARKALDKLVTALSQTSPTAESSATAAPATTPTP